MCAPRVQAVWAVGWMGLKNGLLCCCFMFSAVLMLQTSPL